LKVANVKCASIVTAADDYLSRHPELIEQAAETVRKVPQLRTLHEREMRQRRGISDEWHSPSYSKPNTAPPSECGLSTARVSD
jgi:hypothetical protein